MHGLGLNYRTFLATAIRKVCPEKNFDELWDKSQYLTDKDYKRLLAMYYNKSSELLKEFERLTNGRN